MKTKNIIILGNNSTNNCPVKIGDKKLWSRNDFIFAKENNKYKVFKNRDGNTGLYSKSDIIKYIFS